MTSRAKNLNVLCNHVSQLIGEGVLKLHVSGENIDMKRLVQHLKFEYIIEQDEKRKFYIGLAVGMISED